MITDAFIKQEFIHRILARDAAVIADTQDIRARITADLQSAINPD